MKSRRWLVILSGIFLILALVGFFMVSRSSNDRVRIPVDAANGKMGYIDSSGKIVIATKWRHASPFGPNDYASVSEEIGDSSILTFVSDLVPWFSRFKQGDPRYKIDRHGNKMLRYPDGCGVKPYEVDSHGMFMLEYDSMYRWVLKDGSPAFPGEWRIAIDFNGEDPAAVLNDNRWGFIDRQGKAVTPFQWEKTYGFDGLGRARVEVDGKWGVIDREGKLIIPLNFLSLAGFDKKNMCAAQLASGWGFIDPKGNIQIPFRYQYAENFDSYDMAKVGVIDNEGKIGCGWINRRGEMVVPPIYQIKAPRWAKNFKEHELLPVIGPQGPGLIDRKGRTVIATNYEILEHIEDPAAPGKYWIRAVPPLSDSPTPSAAPIRFHPACYDQTGKLIWNDSILSSPSKLSICAAFAAMISAALFAIYLKWKTVINDQCVRSKG